MKTNKIFKELLLGFIVIAPLVYYMILRSSLPEVIPVHFDELGNPNNYGSKNYIALTIFFLTIGIYFFLRYIPKIDPKNNFSIFSKTFYKLRFILSLFFSILSFIIIFSVQQGRAFVSLIFIVIAFLISIFGNYLSNLRPNYFIGIRSPWTLENESIWKKTHYLTGKIWFFSGILLGLLMIVLPANFKLTVFISAIIILAVIPYIYSYSIYLKINKQKPMENNLNKQTANFESKNSDGWKGVIYFNRQDSRLMVPKRIPGMGWTLNFGNPYTYVLIIAIVSIIIIFNHFVVK